MHDDNFIDSSFRVLVSYPKLITPMLFAWISFFSISIASFFVINWKINSFTDTIYPLFFYYLLFAFFISIACSMLLEMVQQIENGEKPSFFKSLTITLWENLNDMIPVIFVWSLLWIGITIFEIFLSKKERIEREHRLNNYENLDDIKNALEFLNGKTTIGLSTLFFEILKRGIRMTVMMSFCAIAWDNLGYYDAVKKAFRAIKSDFYHFMSGYLSTGLVLIVIFLPPVLGIFIWAGGYAQMHLRNFIFLLLYVIFALSYAIYMEQLFMAQFYMWYRKWEILAIKSLKAGYKPPEIEDIPVPSILDKRNDLKKYE